MGTNAVRGTGDREGVRTVTDERLDRYFVFRKYGYFSYDIDRSFETMEEAKQYVDDQMPIVAASRADLATDAIQRKKRKPTQMGSQ